MVKEFKEKTITINLRKVFEKPVTKRARSALFVVKQAIKKETRAENIKISNLVNETIWEKGKYKPPRKITVKVVLVKDGVNVYLPTEKVQTKETKKEQKSKENIKDTQTNTKVEEQKSEVEKDTNKKTPKTKTIPTKEETTEINNIKTKEKTSNKE
jgi:large subunit ribosomal protein L31e